MVKPVVTKKHQHLSNLLEIDTNQDPKRQQVVKPSHHFALQKESISTRNEQPKAQIPVVIVKSQSVKQLQPLERSERKIKQNSYNEVSLVKRNNNNLSRVSVADVQKVYDTMDRDQNIRSRQSRGSNIVNIVQRPSLQSRIQHARASS